MTRTFSLALAAACAVGCTVQRDAPELAGQDVRIRIMHTSDIHSRLFPYYAVPTRFDEEYGLLPQNQPFGGAARVASIIKAERAEVPRSLWLDSGDVYQGAPVFNLFKGEVETRVFSTAGLDAAVLGNHEFDLGPLNLFKQFDNWATFRPLAANYIFEEAANPEQRALRDIVDPFAVFDLDGVLIGVIGMANWSSMVSVVEGGNSAGVRPTEDRQTLAYYAALVRPSVDLVVVLSHLGLDEDESLGGSEAEIYESGLTPLADVDVILGGHLHIVLRPPKVVSDLDGNTAVLAHSGAFAKYVGKLDLVVRVGEDNTVRDKRSRVTAFSYVNIPVDATVPEDLEITRLLQPYSLELNRTFDLDGVFAFIDGAGSGKVLRNDAGGGDSQLGNLVARAMQVRTGVEAEFALTNSLGIRADFEQGPLTVEQMFNVFPFENSITVMYLSGTEVQELLDFNARKSAARGCRTQSQTSGIYHDMVCSSDACPGGAPACAKNIYIGEDCRGGDPTGEIVPGRCAPLESTALYRVAVNDYIARGGSGYEVLGRNNSRIDTGIQLRDALQDFLREQPVCADSATLEQYGEISCIDSTIEPHDGRIRPVFE